uniref:ribonuclease H n=1 Tax=Latimeria chalumnae TaxID=7897 RepID=H3B5T7_LATCH
VEGVDIRALVDTGSTSSILNEDLCSSHPSLKKCPIKKSFIIANSISGQCLDTLDTVTVGLHIGKKLIQHDFQVVRGAHQPIILGCDFLQQHHAVIDISKGTLALKNITLQLFSKQHETSTCYNNIDSVKLSLTEKQLLEHYCLDTKVSSARGPDDYECTGIIKHHIGIGEAVPIKQHAYQVTPEQQIEVQNQVDKLLQADIIENGFSSWAAPVVLVKKKDGAWQFCLDYHKLSSVTIKDSHPLPTVEDALDGLSGSACYSTMDLTQRYYQQKTAFITGSGLYFKVIPMGLTNAPATFQRLMELVLRGLPWKICLVYLDDVLIYSHSFEEHLQHIEEILSRFQSSRVKLNPLKCPFAQGHVIFLGHGMSQQGRRPDPQNVVCKRLGAFLGLCSYYRKFIKNFVHCALPLYQLTEKNVPFVWTPAYDETFCYLQDVLSQQPVVKFPDFIKPFLLCTDASCTIVGVLLAQVQDNLEYATAYASHVLPKAERRWSAYDRELWAIAWVAQHFWHYFYKQPFTTVTDHKPLLGLWKIPIDNDHAGCRARWALELDPYDWVVVH